MLESQHERILYKDMWCIKRKHTKHLRQWESAANITIQQEDV